MGRGLSAVRSKNNQQSYLLYLLKNLFHKEDLFGGEQAMRTELLSRFDRLELQVSNELHAIKEKVLVLFPRFGKQKKESGNND